jgi:hypothetical protein
MPAALTRTTRNVPIVARIASADAIDPRPTGDTKSQGVHMRS